MKLCTSQRNRGLTISGVFQSHPPVLLTIWETQPFSLLRNFLHSQHKSLLLDLKPTSSGSDSGGEEQLISVLGMIILLSFEASKPSPCRLLLPLNDPNSHCLSPCSLLSNPLIEWNVLGLSSELMKTACRRTQTPADPEPAPLTCRALCYSSAHLCGAWNKHRQTFAVEGWNVVWRPVLKQSLRVY